MLFDNRIALRQQTLSQRIDLHELHEQLAFLPRQKNSWVKFGSGSFAKL